MANVPEICDTCSRRIGKPERHEFAEDKQPITDNDITIVKVVLSCSHCFRVLDTHREVRGEFTYEFNE